MMRFPENIILSTPKLNYTVSNYWVNQYRSQLIKYPTICLAPLNLFVKPVINKQFQVKYLSYSSANLSTKYIINQDHTWDFFNIFFLRKERMYTKLKYSRVTQFDIASGAIAALLAGFIGFLISEKFGFELADSGDFYFLLMYVVFLCFSIKLLLKIVDKFFLIHNFYSLSWLFKFYSIIWRLLISRIRLIISFIFRF